ncbi:MAG: hypothetical protein ACK5WS_02460 [Alphaproteobacteria bacterium]|jgi:SAM-dependent methyltransferase|nr:methyltransferase domain-containing protein [Candidatus Jidaibacter sp.]
MKHTQIFDRAFHIKRIEKSIDLANDDKLISYVSNTLIERINLLIETFKPNIKSVLLIGFTKELASNLKNYEITDLKYTDEELLNLDVKFDLIISNLSLHMVNDITQTLSKYKNMLNESGFFVGTLFGGNTLKSLRTFLLNAELHATHGASPRVIPFIEIKDAGTLLQRAGFKDVISDSEEVTIHYQSALQAAKHLQAIGQSNCLHQRKKTALHQHILGALKDTGDFSDIFDIITLTAGNK